MHCWQQVQTYNGLPILICEDDEGAYQFCRSLKQIRGVVRQASTSIYVVSMGDGSLVGIQNDGISVRDLGELESKPVFRTRVEWFTSVACFSGKAMSRLRGIKDAAIVA